MTEISDNIKKNLKYYIGNLEHNLETAEDIKQQNEEYIKKSKDRIAREEKYIKETRETIAFIKSFVE